MPRDIGGDPEVDQGQPLRCPALDLRDCLLPDLEVELGRRSWGQHGGIGLNANSGRVAGVKRPVASEVAHVMARVSRRRKALEAKDSVTDDVDVLLRYRCELAPQVVERIAVQPARARLELGGVDEVRRADLRHVHL